MNKYLAAIGVIATAAGACLIGYAYVVIKTDADECIEWSATDTTGLTCTEWESDQ